MAPVLLDMQYRMHPLIAEYPSALFYKGKLKSGISAEERPLPQGVLCLNHYTHFDPRHYSQYPPLICLIRHRFPLADQIVAYF